MLSYLVRRLFIMVPTLIVTSFIISIFPEMRWCRLGPHFKGEPSMLSFSNFLRRLTRDAETAKRSFALPDVNSTRCAGYAAFTHGPRAEGGE